MNIPKAARNVENAKAYVNSVRRIPAGTRLSGEGYYAMLLDGAEYLPVVLDELQMLEEQFERMHKRLEYWMGTAIKLCPPDKRPWLEDVRDVDRARLGIEE